MMKLLVGVWCLSVLPSAAIRYSRDETLATDNATKDELKPTLPRDDCGLSVAIEGIGAVYPSNLASPVAIGEDLYIVDQSYGWIYIDRRGKGVPEVIFNLTMAPDGLDFDYVDNYPEYIIGVAPGGGEKEIYVAFGSSVLPDNVPSGGELPVLMEAHSTGFDGSVPANITPVNLYAVGDLEWLVSEDNPLPPNETEATYCCLVNPIFPDSSLTMYQVIYRYKIRQNQLVDPVPLVGFETQAGPGHKGGAMMGLDGDLLLATGDGLVFGLNGRDAAQDDDSHLSKILRISPEGNWTILAKGVRNVQHMELVSGADADPLVIFGDIGGVTAEEVNAIALSDLLDTEEIENFGWGTNPNDGLGREGTFLVGPGVAGIWKTQPPAVGRAPDLEAGYIQPHAQYGRKDPEGFSAISGPVTSVESFLTIKALWGDLNGGDLYATIGDLRDIDLDDFYDFDEPICPVTIIDPRTNTEYPSFNYYQAVMDGVEDEDERTAYRQDPRFFRFPNGGAGVLLERSGIYFRLTQFI